MRSAVTRGPESQRKVGADYEYSCESDFIGTIGDNHWVLGEGVSVSHWGIVGSREADHERRHFRELNSNLKHTMLFSITYLGDVSLAEADARRLN
jgi:hypothetical protein